ncbi:hypothetical protein PAAG_02389 [Paracoccidioides lutzii Pb01]|uniref:Histidine acid phosphatase n=1 Tax=Paracoccidioides lutzii (strain ATCC MYA-826 / Pb01) TaxID=502779 RepID=C1GUR6_PARBA|nr:hypothetical protein PAAG_02389 [Paracoccidioides lutzii Pb01]EEH40334.1 hypothetical protein PAAG_02389 [Paracoccidioides lutzii Pb01]
MLIATKVTNLLLWSSYLAVLGAAQNTTPQEIVWASVIFTHHGDSTPVVQPGTQTLTSYGSQQLFGAGSYFRRRYLSSSDTGIMGISTTAPVPSELRVLSMVEQYVSASATSFLQGLYPPNRQSDNSTVNIANMVNGTVIDFPLDGYQYPEVFTPSYRDPVSTQVVGQANCPAYSGAIVEWVESSEFLALATESLQFYSSIYSRVLRGILSAQNTNFINAIAIWDYLNYQYIHNSTARNVISLEDVNQARYFADRFAFATNGNISTSGQGRDDNGDLLALAGKTFSRYILNAFESNIRTNGISSKLALVFGRHEPIMAFAALAKLITDRFPNFYGMPERGASMVFELFSQGSGSPPRQYPSQTDLMVRFFLRNGSNPSGTEPPLTSYPLFGREVSGIPYREFRSEMTNIMLSVAGWCRTCASESVFCPSYLANFGRLGNRPNSRRLSPAVSGVIGAVVGLVIVALLAGLAAWLFGLRIRRTATRRRSDLGGFKGGNKLASDPDLTFGGKAGQQGVGVFVKQDDCEGGNSSGDTHGGHERIGSWELRSKSAIPNSESDTESTRRLRGNASGRVSLEEDDTVVSTIAEPVKAHEHV